MQGETVRKPLALAPATATPAQCSPVELPVIPLAYNAVIYERDGAYRTVVPGMYAITDQFGRRVAREATADAVKSIVRRAVRDGQELQAVMPTQSLEQLAEAHPELGTMDFSGFDYRAYARQFTMQGVRYEIAVHVYQTPQQDRPAQEQGRILSRQADEVQLELPEVTEVRELLPRRKPSQEPLPMTGFVKLRAIRENV